jgi:hypothetical protein
MNPTTRHDRLEQFTRFNEENPHVYGELVARARRAKERGHRLGMRCLWEVLRYDWSVNIRHDAQEPDLRGYFDLRGHDASRLAAESSPNNQNEVSR